MASLSTCHLGLWLGWQILLNLVKYAMERQSFSFRLILFVPVSDISDGKENFYAKLGPGHFAMMRPFGNGRFWLLEVLTKHNVHGTRPKIEC